MDFSPTMARDMANGNVSMCEWERPNTRKISCAQGPFLAPSTNCHSTAVLGQWSGGRHIASHFRDLPIPIEHNPDAERGAGRLEAWLADGMAVTQKSDETHRAALNMRPQSKKAAKRHHQRPQFLYRFIEIAAN